MEMLSNRSRRRKEEVAVFWVFSTPGALQELAVGCLAVFSRRACLACCFADRSISEWETFFVFFPPAPGRRRQVRGGAERRLSSAGCDVFHGCARERESERARERRVAGKMITCFFSSLPRCQKMYCEHIFLKKKNTLPPCLTHTRTYAQRKTVRPSVFTYVHSCIVAVIVVVAGYILGDRIIQSPAARARAPGAADIMRVSVCGRMKNGSLHL